MSAFDTDPWATEAPAPVAPADEAQADVQPTNTTTTAPNKENTITVNNSSEAKVTTTIKYGSGFDAPWTVFHSDTVADALNTLNNEAKALLELTAKVAKFAKSLDSGVVAKAAAASGGQASQSADTPPGQQGKSCAHGEMTYRTGNGAKGAWAGHFCSLQKGDPDQCKPIFIKVK
ncbi:hypothetical protein [Streptosporangium subroseum]|uniref:hypothetical protein n=1 Tax=Streptosporangium subroseum TaxID=106412 RepID=UPI0030909230|nr:hypothetical protein OHB15_13920 [Streptosporangium subroseum]